MEQMTLFTPPYKYLIDSSSILAQKPSDAFPRLVHKSMWAMIEKSIRDQIIVTCSEIEEEVKNGDICFNYRLQNGKATTRNAIRLLQLMGYDEKIIEKASHQAENFLATGDWKLT